MRSFTVIFLVALFGSTAALKAKKDEFGGMTREVIDPETGDPAGQGHKRQVYEEELIEDENDVADVGLPEIGEYQYENGAGPPEVGIIPTRAEMELAEKVKNSKDKLVEVPESMLPKHPEMNSPVLDKLTHAAGQVAEAVGTGQAGVAFKQSLEQAGNSYVEQVKNNVKINEEVAEDMAFHVVPNVAKQVKEKAEPTISGLAQITTQRALNSVVQLAGNAVNAAVAFR